MRPSIKEQIYQYAFGLSAGMAAMVSGAWLAWPSNTLVPLINEGVLTKSQSGTMVALMDFGNILSPIPIAYLMDIIGRKPALILSLIANCTASFGVLFYKEVYLIYMSRLMAGLGKGVVYAVIPIYLAEVSTVEIRGALSSLFIACVNTGILYSCVIGTLVSYNWLNIVIAINCALFLVGIISFPESPYYLLMRNQNEYARHSLMKFRAITGTNSERFENEFKEMTLRVEQDMEKKGRYKDLISSKGNRRALLIVAVLALAQRTSGITAITIYSTSVMPSTGGGLPVSSYMMIFSLLLALVNYIAFPLVDTVGRKPLIQISNVWNALTTLVLGMFYWLQQCGYDVTAFNWVTYAMLIAFAISYSIGMGFPPSTLVGELFPTNLRSNASSISAIIIATTSCAVNKIFEMTDTSGYGIHNMFFFFAIMNTASYFFTWKYVFETKGKTFNEIQNILNSDHTAPKIYSTKF